MGTDIHPIVQVRTAAYSVAADLRHPEHAVASPVDAEERQVDGAAATDGHYESNLNTMRTSSGAPMVCRYGAVVTQQQNTQAPGRPARTTPLVSIINQEEKEGGTMSIPTVTVTSSEYLLDPETEDLIWGDQLKEGMVVLVEGLFRGSIFDKDGDLERDRWCRVTQLRHSGELIQFIGIYADGSKLSRSYHKTIAWYIKKEQPR